MGLFRTKVPLGCAWIWGVSAPGIPFENHGSRNSPAGARRSAGDRRKRLPLGAGTHAAELG